MPDPGSELEEVVERLSSAGGLLRVLRLRGGGLALPRCARREVRARVGGVLRATRARLSVACTRSARSDRSGRTADTIAARAGTSHTCSARESGRRRSCRTARSGRRRASSSSGDCARLPKRSAARPLGRPVRVRAAAHSGRARRDAADARPDGRPGSSWYPRCRYLRSDIRDASLSPGPWLSGGHRRPGGQGLHHGGV